MYLPYYFTADELNQLALTANGRFPVIMGIDIPHSNSSTWEWESLIDDSYFILQNNGTYSSENGTCLGTTVCSIVNFNNFAFTAQLINTTDNFLKNGNTLVTSTTSNDPSPSNRQIILLSTHPLSIVIYVFKATYASDLVSCTGGECTSSALPSLNVNVFNCRCPNRIVNYKANTVMSEIQVFSASDTVRSTSYIYT